MSRAAIIKRLDELEARLLEAYVDPWSRFLAGLSDAELEALEREFEPGVACVHYSTADYVEGCDCLDRARALEPGGLSEVRFLAFRLHRGEQPGPRPAPEPVVLSHEEPSLDPEPPSAAVEPPESAEVQEEPPVLPRIRRSTDLPDPSPRRGEMWRVTFRPYRPPGWRPRAELERAFEDD